MTYFPSVETENPGGYASDPGTALTNLASFGAIDW